MTVEAFIASLNLPTFDGVLSDDDVVANVADTYARYGNCRPRYSAEAAQFARLVREGRLRFHAAAHHLDVTTFAPA